eukprot:Platyproteum_vivax@DN15592_c0_g1_i1.p1
MWPYVKVLVGEQMQEGQAVEGGGCDPEFNFDTSVNYYGESKMSVEIWNKNEVADDDCIGKLSVDLARTVDIYPNHSFQGNFQIKNNDDEEAGSLEMQIVLHREVGADYEYPEWTACDDEELLRWACSRE